jgi:hypothetical protein
MRTLFFFKCFEEACASFKTLSRSIDQIVVDSGHLSGQWYKVDARIFKMTVAPTVEATTVTGRSMSVATGSSRATSTSTTARAILKGSLYFFLGILAELDDPKKRGDPKKGASTSETAKLTPLTFAAQLTDLQKTADELAQVSLEFTEAQRLETIESGGEPGRDSGESGGRKRRSARREKGPEPAGASSPLKGQATAALKNAEIHWHVALHKAETIFNKSKRMISLIMDQRSRWPTEVKLGAMDITGAVVLSHFFNMQYGINEKGQQLAEWLATNTIGSSVGTGKS